jgi:NAD(P)H-flavin reductase/hemoglobin-like flavoprotein
MMPNGILLRCVLLGQDWPKKVVYIMLGCKTRTMAFALDGGRPQERAGGIFAGQQGFSAFGLRREPVPERHYDPTGSPWAIPRETKVDAAGSPVAGADFDAQLVRQSFAHVQENSDAAMEYFYARLFVHHREMRSMFPHAMRDHMEHVFAALARMVSAIDSPDLLADYLGELGRSHRKFGVKERHYEPFMSALIGTFHHFSGHYWTDQTQAAWENALGAVTKVMLAAANDDAARQPPWWIGEIVQHDQRGLALAVLTIRPDQPLRYAPGQYVAVQVPRWPRVWRNFSIANAPRQNGLIDLHVRAVPGGLVSGSLVHNSRPGDTLLLGRAQGEMTAPATGERDLLCIAGGTGLAPLKAIIEDVIRSGGCARQPEITLWLGARTERDLYDLPDLRILESIYPALTVIPAVSHQPEFNGIKGMLPDVIAQSARCQDREIFISGPDQMVVETAGLLADRVGTGCIHHDPLDAAGSR